MSIFFAGNELTQRKGIFYPSSINYDSDFLTWYANVVAAGSSISTQNIITLNKFFNDLKINNLWNSITQANILCGTSSLSGCLIPIKGATPINNNFVSRDFSVTAGLQSNGLTKWLDTTILESSFSTNPDSVGLHFFIASSLINNPIVINTYFIGAVTSTGSGGSRIYAPNSGSNQLNGQLNVGSTASIGTALTGLNPNRIGISRQNGFLNRYLNGTTNNASNPIGTISTTNTIGVYATAGQQKINASLQFYCFGYFVDLATLDSVVSSMISALV